MVVIPKCFGEPCGPFHLVDHSKLLDQNGQLTMKAAVFYADILGFSTLAARAGARRALEQLSDVAHLLSTEDSSRRKLPRAKSIITTG